VNTSGGDNVWFKTFNATNFYACLGVNDPNHSVWVCFVCHVFPPGNGKTFNGLFRVLDPVSVKCELARGIVGDFRPVDRDSFG